MVNEPVRTALITGAAGGLGSAIARRLGQNHRLVLTGRAAALDDLVAELRAGGVQADGFRLDLADVETTAAAAAQITKQFGRVDVLINNAGGGAVISNGAPSLNSVTLAEWQRVFAVNLTAPFLLAQAFAPGMQQNGWGRIVNIGSRAGRMAIKDSEPSYAASKAGLIGLTRQLAMELSPSGITVNAVAPGKFETTTAVGAWGNELGRSLAEIPAGRLGQPEEVAELVAYLVSTKAGFVTGATVDINGGAFMG